jgi:hypothetical protein
MYDGSALYGVSVSDALWGSTVATTTSDNDGDFSQTSLALGRHSLTYSKSGYLGLTMNELLETDGQTLNVETVRLLPDNCTIGNMSGRVMDAVTGDNMSGVGMWWANGMNKDYYIDYPAFESFGNADSNGVWSLTKDAGWYTINTWRSGYYDEYVNVFACGDQPNQNTSMSEFLNEGEMRIILRWPKTNPVTGRDLDSHLQIPDNANSTTKIYYLAAKQIYYYATDNYTCPSCSSDQLSDNVSLDRDYNLNTVPAFPPGDETITISKVRSGTYSFSVHNASDKSASSSDNLSKSRAKVKVFYCPLGTDCNCNACPAAGSLVKKKFHVPNDNGTLWKVFTFSTSGSGSGFTREREMTYQSSSHNVY